MLKSSCFRSLERFIGSKIPAFIVNILIESGFESEIALRQLNEESVTEIEEFVNVKRDLLINTSYAELGIDEPFKFLIGHKKILLSIPNQIKISKSSKKKGENTVETDSIEPVNVVKQTEKVVNKLQNFIRTIGFDFNLNSQCIFDFECTENNECKCRFQCPLCSKRIPCLFKKYWMVSNVQAHLKKHKNDRTSSVEDLVHLPIVHTDNNSEILSLFQSANQSLT